MDKALLKEEYKRLLRQAVGDRTGSMALMMVLEEVDFYNCPASAKHHLNVPGGLLLHSLNVARTALELCEKMPQFAKCDTNAVLTAALLHDVCKAGKYIKKPDGGYQYRDTELLGHGEESVIRIQNWIHLTDKKSSLSGGTWVPIPVSGTGTLLAKCMTGARKPCACTWLT